MSSSNCDFTTSGVLQGSILGPVFFLLYINEITLSTDKVKFLLFADDTTIFVQGNNLQTISYILNQELIKVSDWIRSNKLTLNTNKTYVLISSPLMARPVITAIKIDNIILKEVNETKFLGVIIDEKVTWKIHIETLQTKVSLLTRIIYRIRNYLNEDCLRQIYFTLVNPYLLYCSAIWGGAYKTYIDILFTTQKKLIRTMHFRKRYDRTECLFQNSRLIKIPEIIHLQTSLFVHKGMHTSILSHSFTTIPHTVARRPQQLRMPPCRTSHAQ